MSSSNLTFSAYCRFCANAFLAQLNNRSRHIVIVCGYLLINTACEKLEKNYFFKITFFCYLQIPASVISSIGTTTNYQQLIVVSTDSNNINYSNSTKSHNSNSLATVNVLSSTKSSSPDENVNSKMIQQTINVQAPRLHPKKRKFDPSELEDDNNLPQQSQQSLPSVSTSIANLTTSSCNNPVSESLPQDKFPNATTLVYHKTSDSNHNGNSQQQQQQQQQQPSSACSNLMSYNTPQQVLTQVVKNTGEVQQIKKRQFTSYR
jgi:hypothetical protein